MKTNNKLRDALTKILNLTNSLDEDCAVDPVEIRDIAKAALAEPVKNYEVGTVEEQMKRFDKFCDSNTHGVVCSYDCPLRKNKSGLTCRLEWVQLPYEAKEGVAK